MSNLEEYLKEWEQEKDSGDYTSFTDFLGANAQGQCGRCDDVFEYDELDENGLCFSCSEEEEEDEE